MLPFFISFFEANSSPFQTVSTILLSQGSSLVLHEAHFQKFSGKEYIFVAYFYRAQFNIPLVLPIPVITYLQIVLKQFQSDLAAFYLDKCFIEIKILIQWVL